MEEHKKACGAEAAAFTAALSPDAHARALNRLQDGV
jgi:hypothetical protein